MKHEIENFDRIELFHQYNEKDNPFIYLTTKIDITNLYNKCKNLYASIGYFITLAANRIDNFKYRVEDGKIYQYDYLKPNYTRTFDDKNIGFFTCDLKDNYNDFIEEFRKVENEFLASHQSLANADQGELWFSCTPWYQVSSVITPFDKKITIPQFLWDKFQFEGGKCYTNLTIMVHHGFADGYHIGLLLEQLNDIIENIDEYIK